METDDAENEGKSERPISIMKVYCEFGQVKEFFDEYEMSYRKRVKSAALADLAQVQAGKNAGKILDSKDAIPAISSLKQNEGHRGTSVAVTPLYPSRPGIADAILTHSAKWLDLCSFGLFGFALNLILTLCRFIASLILSIKIFALNKQIINSPPGSNLLTIVEFLYKPQIVKGVFEQIVADWRANYFSALSEKRIWKARWISVCGCYEFFSAMVKESAIGSLLEDIGEIMKLLK